LTNNPAVTIATSCSIPFLLFAGSFILWARRRTDSWILYALFSFVATFCFSGIAGILLSLFLPQGWDEITFCAVWVGMFIYLFKDAPIRSRVKRKEKPKRKRKNDDIERDEA
jgi:uncharacterized membrane protein YfcA